MRLPDGANGSDALFRLPAGGLLVRPWFDRLTFQLLYRWYFPLSRLWAAATVAEGSVERFAEEAGLRSLDGRRRAIAASAVRTVARAARDLARISEQWERMFFGIGPVGTAALVAAETRRRRAGQALLAGRARFAPLLAGPRFGLVRFTVPSPEALEEAYGDWLDDPDSAYALPDALPEVECSHPVPGPEGTTVFWLRFPSPGRAVGDVAWARVVEPEAAKAAPSLIYLHGLGEETELRESFLDETLPAVRRGLRVIRVEAPWHNRRLVPGRWSGEPFLATAPKGVLDHFEAQLAEVAVLIGWCRARYGTPVAIGGLSLGALTTQLAAVRARLWPRRKQPDAVFLAGTSEDMWQVCFDGSIGRAAGVGPAIRAAGWSDPELQRVRRLTNPAGPPVVDPSRVVVKLGRVDKVLPYAGGRNLVERWKVPSENVFVRRQGHFTIPIAMVRNDRALARLVDILRHV